MSQEIWWGTGEAQQLRVLAGLPKDLSLAPNTHRGDWQPSVTAAVGDDLASTDAHTYMHITVINKDIKLSKGKKEGEQWLSDKTTKPKLS